MMTLNKLHQRRWDAAKKLYQRLKDKAQFLDYDLMFDGSIIKPEQIIIGDTEIYVQIDNCQFGRYECNPECDHGLYDTIESTRQDAKKQFKLVKIINW
jgi:hypothetical protein